MTAAARERRAVLVRQYTHAGWSAREIAGRLGVDKRTVFRDRAQWRTVSDQP